MNLRQRLACFHAHLSERQVAAIQQMDNLPSSLSSYLNSPTQSPLHPLIEEDLEWLAKNSNHHIICFNDDNYPPLLKELADPPCLLFALGKGEMARIPAFAIVGARKASREGIYNARNFATALAECGLVITSGLAYGIDAAAHQAVLKQKLPTIAVIGTGIDVVYPAAHTNLAREISETGLIVSIFPRGAKPLRHHFPQRNAIISGISLGVLVVEAGERSGALITARMAAEQGREVFALPGSIHSLSSKGCNKLIRDGAKLVEKHQDILAEIEPLFKSHKSALKTESTIAMEKAVEEKAPDSQLGSTAQQLLSSISYHPIHPDQLVEETQLTVASISGALSELELTGLVERQNGLYRRVPLA